MRTGIWQLLLKETDGAHHQTCLVISLQLPVLFAGWLVWGGITLGSRTDLHVQSVTMTGHIYRDVILEHHVRLFRGTMGAEFLFMDDNARPHREKHCRRIPSIGGYHPYGLASILTGLESNRACVGYAWPTNCSPSTPSHLSTGTTEGIA
ncbi:nibrin [Trichonephila clavipes]|nr:nibrin [Trichonephila clavipes]